MPGTLTLDTLNAGSGVLSVQNGMSGIAKAWVNFNGTGTVAINGSFNVTSITDNGTGDYTVNFTTAMPDINYSVTTIPTNSGGNIWAFAPFYNAAGTEFAPTTTSFRLATNGGLDAKYVCVAVFR